MSSFDSRPSHPELLLRYLQRERDNLLATLDGLSEYDVRRPMTPSGTNLLGLVKHVGTVQIGYLGECVGRPWPEEIPWDNDAAYDEGLDMYAAADESRESLVDLFVRAKFSQHEVDAGMKDEAIAALEHVRDELRAAAADTGVHAPGVPA